MGVSWSDDTDPIGMLGCRPGPRPKPEPAPAPQPDSAGPLTEPHHHRRPRRAGMLPSPQAAAATITALLARPQPAHRRAYRRYWV
jgi:hypothetical protein